MSSSTGTGASIGIIICSQRQPRVCPQIANFVLETLTDNAKSTNYPPVQFHFIDLQEWNLPLFNEPTIPSQIHNSSDYKQPHTRAWSAEIKKYAAFIFVTPQYNWGYPASIKNAIDYLFNEWGGKPAMVISYGGHGGGKAAKQLQEVLHGVRMRVAETMPAFTFPSKDVVRQAAKGEHLQLSGDEGIWNTEREVVHKAFAELMVLLSAVA